MDRIYLQEAFHAMELLEEEDFRLDDVGVKDILDFKDHDELNDIVDVVDPEADTEEEIKDSYIGSVILECDVCHSPIFKNIEEVEIDEESGLANIEDECPICHSQDGFKIIGQVAPFEEDPELKVEIEDKDDDDEDDDDEEEVKESLTESTKMLKNVHYDDLINGSDWIAVKRGQGNVTKALRALETAGVDFYPEAVEGRQLAEFVKMLSTEYSLETDESLTESLPSILAGAGTAATFVWSNWDKIIKGLKDLSGVMNDVDIDLTDIIKRHDEIKAKKDAKKAEKEAKKAEKKADKKVDEAVEAEDDEIEVDDECDLNCLSDKIDELTDTVDEIADAVLTNKDEAEEVDETEEGDELETDILDNEIVDGEEDVKDESLNEGIGGAILGGIAGSKLGALAGGALGHKALGAIGGTLGGMSIGSKIGNAMSDALDSDIDEGIGEDSSSPIGTKLDNEMYQSTYNQVYNTLDSLKNSNGDALLNSGAGLEGPHIELSALAHSPQGYDGILIQLYDNDEAMPLADKIQAIQDVATKFSDYGVTIKELKPQGFAYRCAVLVPEGSKFHFTRHRLTKAEKEAQAQANVDANESLDEEFEKVDLKPYYSTDGSLDLNRLAKDRIKVTQEGNNIVGYRVPINNNSTLDANESLKEGFEKVDLELEDKIIHVSEEEKEPVPDAEMIVPVSDAVESELTAPEESEDEMAEEPMMDEPVEEEPMEEIPEDDIDEEPIGDEDVDGIDELEDTADEDEEDYEESLQSNGGTPIVESVDYNFDDFSESEFDQLSESYLKKVYENVDSFKTTNVSVDDNTLKVEGLIKFTSGKEKSTQFIFEAKDATKHGQVRFIGENAQISRGKKSFTLAGNVNENRFIAESLNYNYRAKDATGKSTRLYGTVKVGK